MTQHTCKTFDPMCYRCAIGADEMSALYGVDPNDVDPRTRPIETVNLPEPCDHRTVAWDERGTKSASGDFTVTEHCACGRILGTYLDGVL